jgi:hypothetical protein
MEIVKKTDKYLFVKKRNGRFGVKTLKGQWINGEEKQKLLHEAGLIKLTEKKAEEAPAEEAAEAAAEGNAPAEEAAPAAE